MKCALTIFLLLLFYSGIYAGNPKTDSLSFYRIILIDGSEFMGQISTPDSNYVKIITDSGLELMLKKDEIKEILPIEPGILNIDFFATDPAADHLFFFPTARTVPSGKFQFSAYELLFLQLSRGVSQYIEITFGGSFIFPLLHVGAKINPLKMENLNLAVGTKHIPITPYFDYLRRGGLPRRCFLLFPASGCAYDKQQQKQKQRQRLMISQ